MATYNFNVKWVESVRPGPSGRAEYFDTHTEGLGLRIGVKVKTFFVMPRVLRQGQWKQERISLGRVGEITLAEARELAKATLATAAKGEIPAEVGKERRQALVRDSVNTFGKVREDFLPLYRVKRGGKLFMPSAGTLEGMAVAMRTVKAWEDRPIASITQAEIQAWHDGYLAQGKEGAANAYLIHLRAVFRWAKQRGIIAVDPAAAVTAGGAHHARDRVLSYDELVAIWRATGADHPFHAIARLLVLTGQRREEVGGMAWSEIDAEAGLWSLRAARAKNRRQHVIPLSAPALAILKARPRRSSLVFPNRYDKPYSAWSVALDKLREELNFPYWRLHDLRRSLVTHMSEDLRIAPHIIESIVNHVSGFRAGVAGVYNKALYLDERRQALDAWADHLLGKVKEGA